MSNTTDTLHTNQLQRTQGLQQQHTPHATWPNMVCMQHPRRQMCLTARANGGWLPVTHDHQPRVCCYARLWPCSKSKKCRSAWAVRQLRQLLRASRLSSSAAAGRQAECSKNISVRVSTCACIDACGSGCSEADIGSGCSVARMCQPSGF